MLHNSAELNSQHRSQLIEQLTSQRGNENRTKTLAESAIQYRERALTQMNVLQQSQMISQRKMS